MKSILEKSKGMALLFILTISTLGTLAQVGTLTKTGAHTVCLGSSEPYGVVNTPGSTYAWSITGGPGSGTISGNTNTITVLWTLAGVCTLQVIETNSQGCAGTPVSIPILINPAPTATIAGTTTACQNGAAPNITFTGAGGTAPYTFSYTINGGAVQTVVTTSGNNTAVPAPTTAAGIFTYTLTGIQDAGGTNCSQSQTGSAVITVNPLPTATIAGTTTVCQNETAPNITFTGAGGTAPYTFTYTINGGAAQTAVSTSGNSVTVTAPTNAAGTFIYVLTDIQNTGGTTCSQSQTGSAVITVNPLPTATIAGTTAVCQNETAPNVTFTGAGGIAPYTFTYTLNGGAVQFLVTTSGNSVTLAAPTNAAGIFTYTLTGINDSSGAGCSQNQTGSAVITVNSFPAPAISGPSLVCATTTNNVYTTETGMTNYVWTISAGGTITSGGTTTDRTVTVSWNTAGAQSVSVSYTNGTGCTATNPTIHNVTVAPLPATSQIFHN